jgi:four helix bundle protein
MFKFEKLEVWKKALKLTAEIDLLTKSFPRDELYVLTAQMKRSADSIVLNIAEGSTGQSNAEFRQFLKYSLRSGVELVAALYIAHERYLIPNQVLIIFKSKIEEIIRMVQGLKKSLQL